MKDVSEFEVPFEYPYNIVLNGEKFTKQPTRADENLSGGYEAMFDEKGRMCLVYNVWLDGEIQAPEDVRTDDGDVSVFAPNEKEAMRLAQKTPGAAKALYAELVDGFYNEYVLEKETERMEDMLDSLDCEHIELQRVADRSDATEDAHQAGLGKDDIALVGFENGEAKAVTTFPSFAAENVRTALDERGFELEGTGRFEIPCGFRNDQKKFEKEFAQMDDRFLTQLLGRLKSDCEYFLGAGFGYEGHLWGANVENQIAAIRAAAKRLPDEPLARSLDNAEIGRYEDAMKLARDLGSKLDYVKMNAMRPALMEIKHDCEVQGKPWLTKADLEAAYPPLRDVDLAEALKVKVAGYAQRIGEDPVDYAMKLFDCQLPKAWIESNATVLQRFEKPRFKEENVLYAVPETDPTALANGYTSRALVSCFSLSGEAHGRAAEFGTNFAAAYQYANPEIVEEASVTWMRDDYAKALEAAGIEPDEEEIDELIDCTYSMRGWKNVSIAHGNEHLVEVANDFKKELEARGKAYKEMLHTTEEERNRKLTRK